MKIKYKNNYDLTKKLSGDAYTPSKAEEKIMKDLFKRYKSLYGYCQIEKIIYNKELGEKICVNPQYSNVAMQAYYKVAMEILNSLNLKQYNNNNDKVFAIFNYLATNIKYGEGPLIYENGYAGLDTLISKNGICADSANCANFLCFLAGIDCYYVESDIANHAMNVVQADNGKYYFCDCTANSVGAAMWKGTRELEKVNKGWKEFTDFALRNFGISVSPRSFPYLDDEAKECFGEINVEFLEWKYWDYEYICDEEILKSLGITPVD